jgi:hypothetical protein
VSDPDERPASPQREPTASHDAAPEISDDRTELLPFQMEAAAMLDRVLHLEAELQAHRKPMLSRVLGQVESHASALRRLAGRHRRPQSLQPDSNRCASVLLKSGLFDPEYYLRRNPDVAASGIDPVDHYLRHGAGEMRDPGPHFSTKRYVHRYPGVAKSGLNPLYHFIVRGYAQGLERAPSNAAAATKADAGVRSGTPPGAAESLSLASEGRPRLVVYTAMFGDYDDLFMPSLEQAKSCDFVMFTDRHEVPPPWRRGPVSYATPNRFKRNRFYKLLPHRLFPDCEWSLYLDGNVDLRMDPLEFLDRHSHHGSDFLVFRHPRRASILEELAACIELRKDNAELMVRQIAGYLEDGFRHAFALTENNIMLRRHNDPALMALSEAWWAEVQSKSQRDQLSLSYVVEKTAYKGIALFDEGRLLARHYPGVRLRPHRGQPPARDSHDGASV